MICTELNIPAAIRESVEGVPNKSKNKQVCGRDKEFLIWSENFFHHEQPILKCPCSECVRNNLREKS